MFLWISPSLTYLRQHCVSQKLFLILEGAPWTFGFPIDNLNCFEPFSLEVPANVSPAKERTIKLQSACLLVVQLSRKWESETIRNICSMSSFLWRGDGAWQSTPAPVPSPEHTLKDAVPMLDTWRCNFHQTLIQYATENSILQKVSCL